MSFRSGSGWNADGWGRSGVAALSAASFVSVGFSAFPTSIDPLSYSAGLTSMLAGDVTIVETIGAGGNSPAFVRFGGTPTNLTKLSIQYHDSTRYVEYWWGPPLAADITTNTIQIANTSGGWTGGAAKAAATNVNLRGVSTIAFREHAVTGAAATTISLTGFTPAPGSKGAVILIYSDLDVVATLVGTSTGSTWVTRQNFARTFTGCACGSMTSFDYIGGAITISGLSAAIHSAALFELT